MTELDRRQFIQQLIGAELNEVSIFSHERSLCQQAVNGFAGADKIRGFFTNRKHGGTPYEDGRQGVREGVREGVKEGS